MSCRALLVGATGLVGRELLQQLLAAPNNWSVVYAVTRRSLPDTEAAFSDLQLEDTERLIWLQVEN